MLLLVFCSLLSTRLLPKDNVIPKSREKAKKIISKLGLDYNSIHACGNDCILFGGEYEKSTSCHICGHHALGNTMAVKQYYDIPHCHHEYVRIFCSPNLSN